MNKKLLIGLLKSLPGDEVVFDHDGALLKLREVNQPHTYCSDDVGEEGRFNDAAVVIKLDS